MGRPEKPIDPSGGAVAAFAGDLRRLRAQAGNPTYRDMARTACYSPSVLSSAASGHRLPALDVVLAFVAACGGEPGGWQRRWLEVSEQARPAVAARPRQSTLTAGTELPRPAQLPPRPRGFVGRAAELRLLGGPSTAPAVVTGPVGVGKSAFALHHAHRLAAEMVDGQLHADLGSPGLDTQAVLHGFLLALGMTQDRLPAAADQLAGLYRSLLTGRRLLVLLENVRDERQVRPLLADARHNATIVVSRSPLLGLRDVRRVRLDALPRGDSIAMIAGAAPERAAAAPQECDRLAGLCGDLPLALDIAVRKLLARPDVPLARITGRLAEPGALLDWLRIGDLSMRESLNSAYLHLGGAAQSLLHRLARRPPGEPADRAGDPVPAVPEDDEVVDELAEAGLLRLDEAAGVHRLDPLIRAFVVRYATSPIRAARAGEAPASRPQVLA